MLWIRQDHGWWLEDMILRYVFQEGTMRDDRMSSAILEYFILLKFCIFLGHKITCLDRAMMTESSIKIIWIIVTRWAHRTQKAATYELFLHFLFVWAQTVQDGRTLYSKKSYVLCVLILTVFGGKIMSQDCSKIKISRYGKTNK